MVVHLVALLHHLVKFDLFAGADYRLPADRARIVVVSPREQAFHVEEVVDVAAQGHNQVVWAEIDQADGALIAQRLLDWGAFAFRPVLSGIHLLLLKLLELLLTSTTETCLQFEKNSAHTDRVDAQVNRFTTKLLDNVQLFRRNACISCGLWSSVFSLLLLLLFHSFQ